MRRVSRTAVHESGHACGAILAFRRIPKEARCDHPNALSLGTTDFTWPEGEYTQDLIPEYMLAVLLGPLAAGEPDWPPEWPPRRDRTTGGTRGDERQLAAAVSLGHVTEEAWNEIVEGAKAVALMPAFRRMVQLVAQAMELNDVLTDRDLAALLGHQLDELGIPYEEAMENA